MNRPMQMSRYSVEEKQSLSVFKDNDELLKLLRKVFYQSEFDPNEQALLKPIFDNNTDLLTTLRKEFAPDLSWNDPIFGQAWRWIQPKFQDLLTEEVKPTVLGKQDSIKFVEKGLERLQKISQGDFTPLTLDLDIHFVADYSNVSAGDIKRSAVAVQDALSHLEARLMTIQQLANEEEITPEEALERAKKDSAK